MWGVCDDGLYVFAIQEAFDDVFLVAIAFELSAELHSELALL